MAKGKRTKETSAKKNKVVTMPLRSSGETEDAAESDKTEPRKRKSGLARSKEKTGNHAESTIKKEDYKGAKKELRHWVKKVVKERSPGLATKIVDDAEHGDSRSTALVVEFIEKKKKGGGGDDGVDGPSLAEQLMEGPTWEEVLEARRKAEEEEEEEGGHEEQASGF